MDSLKDACKPGGILWKHRIMEDDEKALVMGNARRKHVSTLLTIDKAGNLIVRNKCEKSIREE